MTSLMPTVRFRELDIVMGQGATLFSRDGKSYIDFFTDVGTASLGYDSPESRECLESILRHGMVHSPILFQSDVRESAAARLCHMTGMDSVFFCNSGAEAVEAAVKLVRKHWHNPNNTHRSPVIFTAQGGFHGRTLTGLAAGDGPPYHTDGYGPFPEGLNYRFDPNNWEQHIDAYVDVPSIAAVMFAPVFGNNDVREYNLTSLKALRRWCTIKNIPLIFDEVQSGSGRTGHPTYAQRIGVQPDVLLLGKGVAMGAPCGALLVNTGAVETFTPGSHFSTFGGNPMCSTFLDSMWHWLSKAGREAEIEATGDKITTALREMKGVQSVRQVGMLIAADVNVSTTVLAARCEADGLLLGAFRQGPGPLKITPPLNISERELNDGLRILKTNLEAMCS